MNQGPSDDYPYQRPQQPSQPSGYIKVRQAAERPLITYTILAITIGFFILQQVSSVMVGNDLPAALGMKVNQRIILGEYWRLLTPMLLHGSLLHIGFNMYALFIFGPGLERHYGHWRFLTLYILAGFAGNVFSFIFSPANSLGSSTAIFGLIAAQGVFLYQNRDIFAGAGRAALSQIVMIALINLFIGLQPGIDNWGHMGGLVGGLMFSWFAGPLLDVQGYAPNLSLKDRREPREVFLAAFGVGLIFLAVVGYTIASRAG
jgi:rhomboid protease GluP